MQRNVICKDTGETITILCYADFDTNIFYHMKAKTYKNNIYIKIELENATKVYEDRKCSKLNKNMCLYIFSSDINSNYRYISDLYNYTHFSNYCVLRGECMYCIIYCFKLHKEML